MKAQAPECWPYGGFFDLEKCERRLSELEVIAQSADFWNDNDKAKVLLRERAKCQAVVSGFATLTRLRADLMAALELALDGGDTEFQAEATRIAAELERELGRQEFQCKMSGEFDAVDAIVEINSGAGGTEAQDWAAMLLRMYLRWAERNGFTSEEIDYQPGEGAGLKSVTVIIHGSYAYGHLRSESGVHRLVRISPFDSAARRHTSFASVLVTPDIEEEIDIIIDEKDLRVDTYRSGGAGGQHVNRTDSAVRLTHIPTGFVVACQNERSQHKNKDRAMKILKAKLHELRMREQADKINQIKGERKKIEWGSQIRSYVLQPYRLAKDLRTDFETSSVDLVLDGDLDPFIEAYLLSSENI